MPLNILINFLTSLKYDSYLPENVILAVFWKHCIWNVVVPCCKANLFSTKYCTSVSEFVHFSEAHFCWALLHQSPFCKCLQTFLAIFLSYGRAGPLLQSVLESTITPFCHIYRCFKIWVWVGIFTSRAAVSLK